MLFSAQDRETESKAAKVESVLLTGKKKNSIEKGRKRVPLGVKLSLLRLVHSLINTDNEMFSAA